MSDSLLLAGAVELIALDAGPCNLVEEPRLGSPRADTETVVRELIDGDSVRGPRSGNRESELYIEVTGSNRLEVSQTCDLLGQIVNSDSFTLEWTPDGALTTVIDGLRGQYSRTRTAFVEQQFISYVTLTFPGLPFGRSGDLQFIDLNAGTAGQEQLDSMDSGTFTVLTLDTPHWEGTHSGKGVLSGALNTGPGGHHVDVYSIGAFGRLLPGGATDLSGFASWSLRFKWPAPEGGIWTIQIAATLRSGGVNVSGVAKTIHIRGGNTVWRQLFFPIRETDDVSAVDEWHIDAIQAVLKAKPGRPATSTFWVDDIRALPFASESNTTTEGALILVPNVMGSARAPANFEFTDASPMTGICVHRPPSDADKDATLLFQLDNTSDDTVTATPDNARYRGTYGVFLLAGTVGSGARQVQVTAEQTVDGVVVGSATATGTGAPRVYASTDFDGKFLRVGELTLPPVRVPDDCTTSSIAFHVDGTGGGGSASQFKDLLLLHNDGDTFIVGVLPDDTVAVYIDEPDPVTGMGHMFASLSDRSAAYSVLGQAKTGSGGPIGLDPGDNQLLVVTPEGRPDVGASYRPRWIDERVS